MKWYQILPDLCVMEGTKVIVATKGRSRAMASVHCTGVRYFTVAESWPSGSSEMLKKVRKCTTLLQTCHMCRQRRWMTLPQCVGTLMAADIYRLCASCYEIKLDEAALHGDRVIYPNEHESLFYTEKSSQSGVLQRFEQLTIIDVGQYVDLSNDVLDAVTLDKYVLFKNGNISVGESQLLKGLRNQSGGSLT